MAKRFECDQRGRAPQHDVTAAMDELQELHGELDIAQAARPQFDLPVRRCRRKVVFDPAPHRLHIGDEVRSLRGSPDEFRDPIYVAIPEIFVASGEPCLQQGLELPRACPSLVIPDVRWQRSHQCALLAFGT